MADRTCLTNFANADAQHCVEIETDQSCGKLAARFFHHGEHLPANLYIELYADELVLFVWDENTVDPAVASHTSPYSHRIILARGKFLETPHAPLSCSCHTSALDSPPATSASVCYPAPVQVAETTTAASAAAPSGYQQESSGENNREIPLRR